MSLGTSFSDGAVVAKRNLIKIKRVPDLLVFTTLSPIMFVLLFAYVFGGAIDVGAGSFREYIVAGILVLSLAFGMTCPAIRTMNWRGGCCRTAPGRSSHSASGAGAPATSCRTNAR